MDPGQARSPTEQSIVRRTLWGLLEPKRLVPILGVCVPLVIAQGSFSDDRLAVPLGIVMCLLFVLVAPVSYRVLFPEGLDLSHGAVRILLYGAIGAGVVLSVGAAAPKLLDMGPTFLTARSSLAVCSALFLVGGWGLGRDIDLSDALTREKARGALLAREAELAQLMALRSHLDPHFLFNTLNAIAEWCQQDGAVAERAVLQLSSMLRTVLSGVRSAAWPLERELELLRTLLALHLLRDPELFTFSESSPSPLPEVHVPPMILLPLAENAVKHGPGAGHRGTIRLELAAKDGELWVTFVNPGPYAGPREGSDGLPTVEKRLWLAYGGRAGLRIEGAFFADGQPSTVVELRLPMSGPLPGVMT